MLGDAVTPRHSPWPPTVHAGRQGPVVDRDVAPSRASLTAIARPIRVDCPSGDEATCPRGRTALLQPVAMEGSNEGGSSADIERARRIRP
jgi:hypothetical protein